AYSKGYSAVVATIKILDPHLKDIFHEWRDGKGFERKHQVQDQVGLYRNVNVQRSIRPTRVLMRIGRAHSTRRRCSNAHSVRRTIDTKCNHTTNYSNYGDVNKNMMTREANNKSWVCVIVHINGRPVEAEGTRQSSTS
ncbi:hypothetical protein BJV77DRAFT_941681, partial [Russula vinacea]